MASEGPNSPGTSGTDSGVGSVNWSNASNILASDDARADVILNGGQISYYLKATNFGFALASGVTISGITVEIEIAYGGFGGGYIVDNRARIIKGGTIGATDKSNVSTWPASDTYRTYGSTSELWGETWSYSDINDSTFGFALSVICPSGSVAQAVVDHVRITVEYTSGVSGGAASHYYRQQQRHRQPSIIVPQLITDLEPYRERLNRIENKLAI